MMCPWALHHLPGTSALHDDHIHDDPLSDVKDEVELDEGGDDDTDTVGEPIEGDGDGEDCDVDMTEGLPPLLELDELTGMTTEDEEEDDEEDKLDDEDDDPVGEDPDEDEDEPLPTTNEGDIVDAVNVGDVEDELLTLPLLVLLRLFVMIPVGMVTAVRGKWSIVCCEFAMIAEGGGGATITVFGLNSPSAKTRQALIISLISRNDTDWMGIPVFFASVYADSGFFSKSNSSHLRS